ncbi:ABC transporter substrate-binding protein [Caenimonas soli]|uniref:ABC transporter substrate-binding protein n=1 Tax=Caenimonas soli TaxID=2735555 RepID=UPI001555EE0F|nr:ABC transporter substrate-binding protein [Caenimonas soli]NPC57897.1 ABC transporter substrate-binding protein [Caenimonas soli]
MALGFNTFFAKVNATGGVHGNKVVLRVHDDRFDPAETVKVLKEVAADPEVLAIFGVVGTPSVGAVAKSGVLAAEGLALIGPGTGIPALQSSPNMAAKLPARHASSRRPTAS